MKETTNALIKVIFACITSLIILNVFVLFYHNTGVHINNPTGATDYKWEPYQEKSTMIEGFAFLKMDGNGYNNIDIIDGTIDTLLMGSSQMEAVHVKQTENTAALMNVNQCYNLFYQ